MANTSYTGLETSTALMLAYETLALEHERKVSRNKSTPGSECFYGSNFGLLVINSAIVEGAIRSVISGALREEIENLTKSGAAAGRSAPTKPEELLARYHTELEMNGGWEKLKEQYAFYYGTSLEGLFGKDLKASLDVLFVIRNVLAHGTAIIQPDQRMDESMKMLYPYSWQCKLQAVVVYLEKEFRGGDVFKNLENQNLPKHFMEKTKEAAVLLLQKHPSCKSVKIFSVISTYTFGCRV